MPICTVKTCRNFATTFISACFLFSAVFLFAKDPASSKKDEMVAWANTSLLNTLFISEYIAVVNKVDEGGLTNIKSRKDFFTSKEGQALFNRAAFGLVSSETRGQWVKDISRAETVILEQDAMRDRERIFSKNKVRQKTLETVLWPLVSESFVNPSFREYWDAQSALYAINAPVCPDYKSLDEKFLESKKIVDKRPLQEQNSAWRKAYSSFSLLDVRCIAWSSLTRKSPEEKTQVDAAMFFSSFEKAGTPFQNDPMIRLISILNFFNTSRFPEALRIILELQDEDTSYRLAYEIIQRIYSLEQRGKGEIALQGL